MPVSFRDDTLQVYTVCVCVCVCVCMCTEVLSRSVQPLIAGVVFLCTLTLQSLGQYQLPVCVHERW